MAQANPENRLAPAELLDDRDRDASRLGGLWPRRKDDCRGISGFHIGQIQLVIAHDFDLGTQFE